MDNITNLRYPPHELPKGIWHDSARNRYRVRVYQRKTVYHLSYHKSLDEALQTYNYVRTLSSKPNYLPVTDIIKDLAP